jgi:hypothetical protein
VDNIKACMEEAGASDANLNSYLTTLQNSIIMRCLNAVFEGPEIVEEVRLFERYGYNDQDVNELGSFVGWEIKVGNAKDIAVQLDAIETYFTGTSPVRLYLYKSGVKNAIWTEQYSPDADQRTLQEFIVDNVVLNTGLYWLGYFQDDLIDGSMGIWEQVSQWNKTLCFGTRPVKIPADGNEIDVENRQYPGQTYGLNLHLSSFKDHTQQIIRKANMFDELIGLSMAQAVIEQVIYATRSNGTQRVLADGVEKVSAQMDLNGVAPISDGPQKIISLKDRISREAKKVKELFYPKPKAQSVSLC